MLTKKKKKQKKKKRKTEKTKVLTFEKHMSSLSLSLIKVTTDGLLHSLKRNETNKKKRKKKLLFHSS